MKMMNGMQIYNICKKCVVSKLKWRHWLLLFLLATVVVFKTVPGLGGVYTASVYPKIGYVLSSFSGKFCFAVGDVFVALSVAWVVVYPLCNLWRKYQYTNKVRKHHKTIKGIGNIPCKLSFHNRTGKNNDYKQYSVRQYSFVTE